MRAVRTYHCRGRYRPAHEPEWRDRCGRRARPLSRSTSGRPARAARQARLRPETRALTAVNNCDYGCVCRLTTTQMATHSSSYGLLRRCGVPDSKLTLSPRSRVPVSNITYTSSLPDRMCPYSQPECRWRLSGVHACQNAGFSLLLTPGSKKYRVLHGISSDQPAPVDRLRVLPRRHRAAAAGE